MSEGGGARGLDPGPAAEHFEAKYRTDPDPWQVTSSWYERRKYALTMASLPREHYRAVWEPGCSIGVLTELLTARAELIDASDLSPTAVQAAGRRLAGRRGVTVARAALPAEPPRAEYDLVMMSEVLYYLAGDDRERSLAVVDKVLTGDLVVVHWRHHPEDAWAAGADVNAQVRSRPGWRSVVRHDEDDFVLDVLSRA